jgi:ribosomal-protein-alanine N-acetyltransferase
MPSTVIQTERMLLRAVTPDDFDPLFSLVFSDEDVMQYLSGQPLKREQALRLFREVFDHEGTGLKPGVLVSRQTGEVLGYAGLMVCTALGDNDLELGFVLRKNIWGLGYASEIGRAQLEYGFRTTDRLRLLAQVRPANTASVKALRKLGMHFVKEYERPERGTWQVFARSRDA